MHGSLEEEGEVVGWKGFYIQKLMKLALDTPPPQTKYFIKMIRPHWCTYMCILFSGKKEASTWYQRTWWTCRMIKKFWNFKDSLNLIGFKMFWHVFINKFVIKNVLFWCLENPYSRLHLHLTILYWTVLWRNCGNAISHGKMIIDW